MDWQAYFFGFEGRLGRAGYWLFIPIAMIVLFLVGFVASRAGTMIGVLVILLGGLPIVAGTFAVTVKRLHDRGKSGWWIIVFSAPALLSWIVALGTRFQGFASSFTNASMLAPVPGIRYATVILGSLIGLWALVELGFLRGTIGPNRYGSEPGSLFGTSN